MGVYNNNKDGTRSTLANTIQVVDAPMEQFVSKGEFSAVTPSDVSADNKLVAENEVTKTYDTMPSAEALHALPNNTIFYIQGYYAKNDHNGGYYQITNNYTNGSLKIIYNGVTKYLIALENEGVRSESINLCRYGVRECPITSANVSTPKTVENTYATQNSNIISNIVLPSSYNEFVFPVGRFYFESPITLTTHQTNIRGEVLPPKSNLSQTRYEGAGYTNGTMLCFPFLTNGQSAIVMGQGTISNVCVYGSFDTYNFTIDRTKILTAPNECVVETIKEVDGNQVRCTGIKRNNQGIIKNVTVAGFYTAIDAGTCQIEDVNIQNCHYGVILSADAQADNMFGWSVHTFIKAQGSAVSVHNVRVDSCVHGIEAVLLDGGTFTDIDADWCADSLVICGNGTNNRHIDRVRFENLHGRYCMLKRYNESGTEPTATTLGANTDGYGVVRVLGNTSFTNNYVSLPYAGHTSVDSATGYTTPALIFTADVSGTVSTIKDNIFELSANTHKDDVREMFQTQGISNFYAKFTNPFGTYAITNQGAEILESLSDLSDISISSPQSGDVLVYDGEKWENAVFDGYERKKIYTQIEATLIDGKFVDYRNGALSNHADFHYCELSIIPNESYRVTGAIESYAAIYAFYTENGTFISAYPTTSITPRVYGAYDIIAPENAYILKCSGYKNTPLNVYKIEEGGYEAITSRDELYGKKWFACGDSFTAGNFSGYTDKEGLSGNYSDAYDPLEAQFRTYPYWIGKRTGILYDDKTCASSGADFTNVSGAIVPFSSENSVKNYTMIPADCDFITLQYGINEIDLTEEQIGTSADTTNETLWGAYYVVLNSILTANPTVKIGIIISDGWMCDSTRYYNALKDIAKYYRIPILDLSGGDDKVPLMINSRGTVSATAKTIRGNAMAISYPGNYHPTPEGHEYRSTVIENFLRTL